MSRKRGLKNLKDNFFFLLISPLTIHRIIDTIKKMTGQFPKDSDRPFIICNIAIHKE